MKVGEYRKQLDCYIASRFLARREIGRKLTPRPAARTLSGFSQTSGLPKVAEYGDLGLMAATTSWLSAQSFFGVAVLSYLGKHSGCEANLEEVAALQTV